MEALIDKEEAYESEEDTESEKEEEWDINIENEKSFWSKTIITYMIYLPKNCPYCHKETFRMQKNLKKYYKSILFIMYS